MARTLKRSGRKPRPGTRFPSQVVADNLKAYRRRAESPQEAMAKAMKAHGHDSMSQVAVGQVKGPTGR